VTLAPTSRLSGDACGRGAPLVATAVPEDS
jgi:hypothetical protein